MGLLRGEEERIEYMQGLSSILCCMLCIFMGRAAYCVQRKSGPHFRHPLYSNKILTGMLRSSCTSALGRPFLFPSAGSSQTGPGKAREKAASEFTLLARIHRIEMLIAWGIVRISKTICICGPAMLLILALHRATVCNCQVSVQCLVKLPKCLIMISHTVYSNYMMSKYDKN